MLSPSHLSLFLAIALMLHVTEEFYFPGGFIEWYRELVPPKTTGIRFGYLVFINTAVMFLAALALFYGDGATGASIFLALSTAMAFNALFHISGVVKLKKYSPGVVTAVVLFLPLYGVGLFTVMKSGLAANWEPFLFAALAAAYHANSLRRQAK
ncbi:HXXEE domain-containing protein [Martelella sp. HB161492]|uniref:HXXEE domain-containing protein n=1 Tax=Martelella sp. HB161492 TaxID=2720726 RepID=UPI0015921233|nr:HXXEE domain-containing protein [Martelella sp. HB161492]